MLKRCSLEEVRHSCRLLSPRDFEALRTRQGLVGSHTQGRQTATTLSDRVPAGMGMDDGLRIARGAIRAKSSHQKLQLALHIAATSSHRGSWMAKACIAAAVAHEVSVATAMRLNRLLIICPVLTAARRHSWRRQACLSNKKKLIIVFASRIPPRPLEP